MNIFLYLSSTIFVKLHGGDFNLSSWVRVFLPANYFSIWLTLVTYVVRDIQPDVTTQHKYPHSELFTGLTSTLLPPCVKQDATFTQIKYSNFQLMSYLMWYMCQVRLRWLCDAALPGCDCVNRVTHQVVTDDESVLHEFSSSSRLETKKQNKFHHEEHVARICITTSPQISQYTAVIIRNKVEISLTV